MPYFPGPAMYPAPMSSKRAGAIASAVMMIISAVFTLIAGIIYTVEGLWWEDFWVALGVFCFVSFSMAIVGTIAIVRRQWRFAPLVASGLLIACGSFSMIDLGFWGLIILVLAVIALVLLAASWGQFNERSAYQYPMPYMMPPPGAGVPMGGMGGPVGGMGGPVGGMGGPVGSMGMAPPPMVGAPPPGPAYPPQGGAQPPRPVPVEEEQDVIVDTYVGEG